MTRTVIIPTDCYPLTWPLGVARTKSPVRSSFNPRTYSAAVREVRDELAKLNARNVVVSTNLAGDSVRNGDHGAAVYWTGPAGAKSAWEPHVITCDRYLRLESNLHAIALSLDALRGLDRWGAVRREQAFAGFRALPAGDAGPTATRPWRDVLGVPTDGWVATAPPIAIIAYARDRHRDLIRQHHPDRGGDAARAAEINAALDQAVAELESP